MRGWSLGGIRNGIIGSLGFSHNDGFLVNERILKTVGLEIVMVPVNRSVKECTRH